MKLTELIASEIIDDAFEIVYLASAFSNLETVMARNQDTDHVLDDAMDRILPRLQKRLVAIASNLRNFILDSKPSRIASDDWDQATERIVGLLKLGTEDNELILREACNKLIHADSLDFPMHQEIGVLEGSSFNVHDCVAVYGTDQKRRTWSAIINIPQLSTAAYIAASIVAGDQ